MKLNSESLVLASFLDHSTKSTKLPQPKSSSEDNNFLCYCARSNKKDFPDMVVKVVKDFMRSNILSIFLVDGHVMGDPP